MKVTRSELETRKQKVVQNVKLVSKNAWSGCEDGHMSVVGYGN